MKTKKLQFRQRNTGDTLKEFELNLKQHEFIQSHKRYILFSGGFGAGKTLALIIKAIKLSIQYPNNNGLIGRLHYQDLRDTVYKDFLSVCPEQYIEDIIKSERKIILFNGSELIFRHLDKISEKEIRSLNLGFFAIDQVEDVSEPVYLALKGRLRRDNTSQQGFMTANPANTWIYREFKQVSKESNQLFEISTLENPHLSKEYINDLMTNYPEYWRKQFVYGIWDPAIMGDRNVYHNDIIKFQNQNIIKPEHCGYLDDIRLYGEPKQEDILQMGVDTSEGIGGDASVLSVVNTVNGEEVAFWQGQLPPDVLVEKAFHLIKYLNKYTKRNMMIIPEINGLGIAFLSHLKKSYSNFYLRDVFIKQTKEKKQVMGWRTTTSTKPLLINNHVELLRNKKLIIHTPEILEQMKTFVYTDDVKKQGMGADPGFHDDAIIAHSLASFFDKPSKLRLMSSDRNFKKEFVKKAYNPLGEDIHSIFERHYDWLTDSKHYE